MEGMIALHPTCISLDMKTVVSNSGRGDLSCQQIVMNLQCLSTWFKNKNTSLFLKVF